MASSQGYLDTTGSLGTPNDIYLDSSARRGVEASVSVTL